MSRGKDPFFNLSWGMTKTFVEARVEPLKTKLPPLTGTWFDGNWIPPLRSYDAYKCYCGYDLDGILFEWVEFVFARDKWIGLFGRLSVVRLMKTFGEQETEEDIEATDQEIMSKLIAKFGQPRPDPHSDYFLPNLPPYSSWWSGANCIQRFSYTYHPKLDDCLIAVAASPLDG